MENQVVQSTVESCWPGIESAHDKLQCETVESVLTSIFDQVKAAESRDPPASLPPASLPLPALPLPLSTEAILTRQARLDALSHAYESVLSRRNSVKNTIKDSIAAYTAQSYTESLAKSQFQEATQAFADCIVENGGTAATLSDKENQEKAAVSDLKRVEDECAGLERELLLWQNKRESQSYEPDLDAVLAACTQLELTNEECSSTVAQCQATISAQEQAASTRKAHLKSRAAVLEQQSTVSTQLSTDISDLKETLGRLTSRLEAAYREELAKSRVTRQRTALLEQARMECHDYTSQASHIERLILKQIVEVQAGHELFKSMSAVFESRLEGVTKAVCEYQCPHSDLWKASELSLIDHEFEGRKPALSREIRSRDSGT